MTGADPEIEEGGGIEWGLVWPCGARSASIYFARITNSVVIVGGWGPSAKRRTRGGDMLPTLAGGWRASALRGEEAGRFREVAGVSIVAAGGPRSL